MPAKTILDTDNGELFNITLDPGYCFAMCVDMAKSLLNFQKIGRPKRFPGADELNSGKWSIMQSAYEINSQVNDRTLIEAQGLEVRSTIAGTNFGGNFATVANAITAIQGTTVFGIMGPGGGHELMWHRDDANGVWLYLDPNEGLIRFDSVAEASAHIENDLSGSYDTLNETYDAFTVELA